MKCGTFKLKMITKYVSKTNQSKFSESVEHIKLKQRMKGESFHLPQIEKMGLIKLYIKN